MKATLADVIERSQARPLFEDWFFKYQHVERLGSSETEGLLDGTVYVQDKIDGANMSVALSATHGLLIASRNNLVFSEAEGIGPLFARNWGQARDVILGTPGYRHHLEQHREEGAVLRGEWLVKHTVRYPKEAYGKFYVFEVEGPAGVELLAHVDFPIVPVIATRHAPSAQELVALVDGPDFLGAGQKEGVVVKRLDFVNRYGRVTWGKLVQDDFRDVHKTIFRATKAHPIEEQFAAEAVTHALVAKTIANVSDQRGERNIRHMQEVLGRVWHDAVREEMWDFAVQRLMKSGAPDFNFRSAMKAAEKRAREYALDIYNGIDSVHGAAEVRDGDE